MQKGFLSILGILLSFIILMAMIVIVLNKISTRDQNLTTDNPRQIEEKAKQNIQNLQQKSRQNQSIEVEP